MPYYLHRCSWIGIDGDLEEALAAEFPGDPPKPNEFEPVSAEEYSSAILDLRFEEGEWQQ